MSPVCAPNGWLMAAWTLCAIYLGFLLGLLAGAIFWRRQP